MCGQATCTPGSQGYTCGETRTAKIALNMIIWVDSLHQRCDMVGLTLVNTHIWLSVFGEPARKVKHVPLVSEHVSVTVVVDGPLVS